MHTSSYKPQAASSRGLVSSLLAFTWLLFLGLSVFAREIQAEHSEKTDAFDASQVHDAHEIEPRQTAAKPAPTSLTNNVKINSNISPGTVMYFQVPQETINQALSARDALMHQELRKRSEGVQERDVNDDGYDDTNDDDEELQDISTTVERRQGIPTDGTVYITINTCLQPDFRPQSVNNNPPQLSMWISTTSSNQNPGPETPNSLTDRFDLTEGFAAAKVSSTAGVYIGISAPNVTVDNVSHDWNFDVAASVNWYYHAYNPSGPTLYMIDSDSGAALLVTDDLRKATPPNENFNGWISGGPRLSIFAQNINDPSTMGLRHSFCGLAAKSTFSATNIPANLVNSKPLNADNVEMGITYNRPTGEPEQQIYIPGLNKSTTYYGFLAMTGNSTSSIDGTVGGGGTVYQSMNFTTKTDINCQVIFNLSFCDSVAYAVPSNPFKYNMPQLAALYDNSTQTHYQNFNYSLQQIPCNTTSSAQYSLVKNCTDCANAYKTWLCAVTMPKCADYTLPSSAANTTSVDTDSPGIVDSIFGDDDSNNLQDPYAYLIPRNLGQAPLNNTAPPITNASLLLSRASNSSRNADIITAQIQPGPYREILPCEDLCYELVRSCPASFGFGCPLRGKGLESSYGQPGVGVGGVEKCSAPGAVYYQSSSQMLGSRWAAILAGVIVSVFCIS